MLEDNLVSVLAHAFPFEGERCDQLSEYPTWSALGWRKIRAGLLPSQITPDEFTAFVKSDREPKLPALARSLPEGPPRAAHSRLP